MALVKRFEELEAWQAARSLTYRIYWLTRRSVELSADVALCDQMRRAAVSTMNNIAEGFDSGSRIEFRRFLRYAARSASEVQSCLYVARDQGYFDQSTFDEGYVLAQRVRQLSSGLIRRLATRNDRPPRENEIAETGAIYEKRLSMIDTSAAMYASTSARPHARTPAQ